MEQLQQWCLGTVKRDRAKRLEQQELNRRKPPGHSMKNWSKLTSSGKLRLPCNRSNTVYIEFNSRIPYEWSVLQRNTRKSRTHLQHTQEHRAATHTQEDTAGFGIGCVAFQRHRIACECYVCLSVCAKTTADHWTTRDTGRLCKAVVSMRCIL